MILRHSQRDPQSVAQVFINWNTLEKEYLTFTNIYEAASKFARGLMHLGIEKGDTVALGTDNAPEWTTTLIGIQMSGAVPLLFMFDRRDGSDLEAMLTKHGQKCKAIVFPGGIDARNTSIINQIFKKGAEKGQIVSPSLPNVKWAVLMSDMASDDHFNIADLFEMGNQEHQLPYLDPEDVAAVFPTSGSTGLPKLIPHTHFSLLIAGCHLMLTRGISSTSMFNERPFIWIGGYASILISSSSEFTL